MPADAEAVFDVLSDLENTSSWLPGSIEVELSGPHLIRLWLPGLHSDVEVERRVAIDWERMRLTWGTENTATCTGSLQVLHLAPGRSAVTVQVTGPPGARVSSVEAWTESALDALAAVVASDCRANRVAH